MGMVGTVPARDATFLVGDAAGLVNPLQGEGITQALTSGRSAGLALLQGPRSAADAYKTALARDHLPYHRIAASVQHAMVARPRAISVVGRVLTAPGIGRVVAPGWGLYWNELLGGAAPSFGRRIASCAELAGRAATARTSIRQWFDDVLPAQLSGGPDQPAGGSLAGNDSSPHSSTSSSSGSSELAPCPALSAPRNLSSDRRFPFLAP